MSRTISYDSGYTVQEICELAAIKSRTSVIKWLKAHARPGYDYSKPDGRRIRISLEAGDRYLHHRGRKKGEPLPGMMRATELWEKHGYSKSTVLRLINRGEVEAVSYRRATYIWRHQIDERIEAARRPPLGYMTSYEAAKILGIHVKAVRMRMVREGIPIRLWWSIERHAQVILIERDIVMRWAHDYAHAVRPDQVVIVDLAKEEGVSPTAVAGWMARNGYEITLVYDGKKRVRAVSKKAAKAYRSRKNRRGGYKKGA